MRPYSDYKYLVLVPIAMVCAIQPASAGESILGIASTNGISHGYKVDFGQRELCTGVIVDKVWLEAAYLSNGECRQTIRLEGSNLPSAEGRYTISCVPLADGSLPLGSGKEPNAYQACVRIFGIASNGTYQIAWDDGPSIPTDLENVGGYFDEAKYTLAATGILTGNAPLASSYLLGTDDLFDADWTRDAWQAGINHDNCYHNTTRSKKSCDDNFETDVAKECSLLPNSAVGVVAAALTGGGSAVLNKISCLLVAKAAALIMADSGGSASAYASAKSPLDLTGWETRFPKALVCSQTWKFDDNLSACIDQYGKSPYNARLTYRPVSAQESTSSYGNLRLTCQVYGVPSCNKTSIQSERDQIALNQTLSASAKAREAAMLASIRENLRRQAITYYVASVL